jgi:hypothetical protein
MGSFFETFEVQALVLVLIAVDVSMAILAIYLQCGALSPISGFPRFLLNIIDAFTGSIVQQKLTSKPPANT